MFDESLWSEALGLESFTQMSPQAIFTSLGEQNLSLSDDSALSSLDKSNILAGKADLTIDRLSLFPVPIVGKPLNFNYRIKNIGTAPADPTSTAFFLSKDNILDTTDTLLGADEIISLNQGAKKLESYTVALDSSLNPGEYYLFAQADPNDRILESDETNNLLVKSFTLTQADIAIKSLPSASSAIAGKRFDFNYTIENQGTAKSSSSNTNFYLSQDRIVDENDLFLTTQLVGSFKPGILRNQRVNIEISSEIQSGDYYIIAKADGNNDILESNEANNLAIQPLQITGESLPDLLLTSTATPDRVELGTTLPLNYTLINQGKANAQKSFLTYIFLSKDTVLDSSDRTLSFITEANLAANSTRMATQSVILDNNLTGGAYYLIYKTDPFNQVVESNENNNTLIKAITITSAVETANNTVYSPIYGYGTVNAAAAVARVLGVTTLADVADLGGNYWGADLLEVPEVWARGYTGQNIVVAVLDSGVDRTHSDLSSNIWKNDGEIAGNGIDDDRNGYVDDLYGWNFMADDNNTLDVKSHGTHVAGIIAAAKNGSGTTGIAYNARIMPVKVLSDRGSGTYDALIKGIYYAVGNGAKVINMSLAGSSAMASLQDAIKYASSKGVIVVSAAGNANADTPSYPAYYATSNGIAVGAVDKSNRRAGFSNKAGNNPNLVYIDAPGVNIYSTLPKNSYGYLSGTSMATPHIAGVVALMLSANNNLTDLQIRQILSDTAIPLA